MGKSCRKSRTAPDKGHEEEQEEDRHRDGASEHGDGCCQPAREVRLRHHEANRVLEDERQKDPDEDDQEGVADRLEGREDAHRGGDEEQRAHRQDKLDARRRGRAHGRRV